MFRHIATSRVPLHWALIKLELYITPAYWDTLLCSASRLVFMHRYVTICHTMCLPVCRAPVPERLWAGRGKRSGDHPK